MKKNTQIFYVIHPTRYQDFDILAIGNRKILRKLSKTDSYYDYISSVPLVVIDTCDTVKEAVKRVRELQNTQRSE